MRIVAIGVMLLALVPAGLVSVAAAQELEPAKMRRPPTGGQIPASNVAGKKLIRLSQELIDPRGASSMAEFDLPAKVMAWQGTGYDGLAFSISSYNKAKSEELGSRGYTKVFGLWWDVLAPRTYDEFVPEIEAFKSVKNWGRLTDNFLWSMTSVGGNPQDWFDDQHWQVVLANARLLARISKEIGFKGITLDTETYFSGNAPGKAWLCMWSYKLYASSGYRVAGEVKPRPFAEVAAKVRQRASQYAQAISSVYPDITLFVIPGWYCFPWMSPRYGSLYGDGTLPGQNDGLYPAFIDGLLLGLDERATIVAGSEYTYMNSQYKDMLVIRDAEKEQALALSTVPELARKRISFAVGIWTDAGLGTDRFSDMDVKVNHRDPERHKHAVHNALAASDEYAWQWGENPWQWLATEPTSLIREYWQANVAGHQPQDLWWEPEPKWDMTDYTDTDAAMAAKDAAFWNQMKNDGWKVAAELPIHWRFLFDTEFLLLQRDYYLGRGGANFDDTAWPLISALKCWQSQGTMANGPAIYRVTFDAPADLNLATENVMLAFGGYSPGTSVSWFDVWVNGTGYGPNELIDVANSIRPGHSNLVALRILNKSGPDGLMGHVKLLVRNKLP